MGNDEQVPNPREELAKNILSTGRLIRDDEMIDLLQRYGVTISSPSDEIYRLATIINSFEEKVIKKG